MNLGKKGRDKERAERMKERKKANEEINAWMAEMREKANDWTEWIRKTQTVKQMREIKNGDGDMVCFCDINKGYCAFQETWSYCMTNVTYSSYQF